MLLAALVFSAPVFSQRIVSIDLFPTNTSVVIKFLITPGSSCSGYTVFHSLDSLSFSEIGSEPGICGASTENEEKSFTHGSPVFNQKNYYRIRLDPYVETSVSKSVFLSPLQNADMLAYPNPFYSQGSDVLNLKFFASNTIRLTGNIFDQCGKPVKPIEFTVVSDHASVRVSGLANGLYFIRLTDGSKMYSSKFIMLR